MSDTEKDNNIQRENTENPTENELPKNEENTTEEPIKLKKSGKSRRKSKKNNEDEGSFSQDIISSSMSFAVDQQEVLDLINQIIEQIENTKNKLNIESFLTEPLEKTKQVKEGIENTTTITKEDSKKYVLSLKEIVKQVSDSWNPPLTNSVREDLTQIRNQLNSAIVSLHGSEAPLSEFKELDIEPLNQYIIDVSKKIDDANKFFNAVENATNLVINRDAALLEEGLKDLSEYINNAEAPYDTFVNQMYYAFLYYQAAAIKSSYFGRKEFESYVDQFFKTQPEELRDICFELLDHFYTIMLKANPRSIEKDHDTIVKDLFYSLASPAKMDYAHTYYYLKSYSLNSRHMLFFKDTLNDIKSCFHGQNDPTKIDFKEAMEILRNDVSTGYLNYSPTLPKKFKSDTLKVIDSQTIPDIDEKINPHYYYSDRLILNTLIPNGYEFKYKESVNQKGSELAYVQVANELSLPQYEINRNQTYIHVPSVGQSSRYISNSLHSLNVSFNEIGRVFESKFTPELNQAPTAQRFPKLSYFKFTISTLKINNIDVSNLIGMTYVLDRESGQPTSEPLFFLCNNGEISFLNSANKEAIFPLNDSKQQYLVLRLLHKQAIDTKKFLSYISSSKDKVNPLPSPFNFAVSAIPLFDDKENFIEQKSFSDRFTLVNTSISLASDTTVIQNLKTSTNESIPVTTEISITQIDTLPTQGIARSFIQNLESTLLLSSTKIERNSSEPLITLSNIRFTFKNPPKGTYVYFTAFYTETEENIKAPKGLPVILGYEEDVPQQQYTSTIIPTNKTCNFPDIIRVIINERLSKTGHIIFHFYTVSPDSPKGQPNIYKTAVLPLYNSEGAPVRSNPNIEITSFEFKEVQPNKYLYPGKMSSQSKVYFNLSVPSVYVPPAPLLNLLSKKLGEETPKIETSKLSKDVKFDSFVPTVARYLTIMGPGSTLSFVYYLAQFDESAVAPLFIQYAYRIFTPLRIPDDFPQRFFSSYSAALTPYLKVDNTSDNVLNLIYFLKTCKYFLHIAIVTILTLKKEKKPIEGTLLDYIIKFSKAVSTLISLMANLEKAADVNVAYSSYMHIISPVIEYQNSLPIISDHLKRFNSDVITPFDLTPLFPPPPEVKPKHPPPEPPIPKPKVVSEDIITTGLRMKLSFIKTFANSNSLLANCGYCELKNVKIFENLFDSLTLSMTKSKQLIPEYIYLLSEFVRTIENFPEISMRCANVYIPYLTYAVEYVNAEEFKDYELFQHYLVPILFVLHTADKRRLVDEYYNNLICGKTKDEKKKFIDFLETLIVRTLTPNPGTSSPAEPIDLSECANSEEEYKLLQEVNRISKDINYTIYNELTVRILDFIADYFYRSKSIDITDKQADAFSSLFIRICGYHQLQSNFDDIMLTIARFVDNYYSKIYFNHTESYDKLVYLALHLVSRNLRVARSAGVAMVIHLTYIDYHTTENIIASMHYFYSNFVKCIFECPKYRIAVYKSFLDRLKLFITSYRYEEFVDYWIKQHPHARTIYNSAASMRSSNKSPELRVRMMHRIADQLYGYPLLRLKWLREIVNNNTKECFYAQAFEGQVQVVALIDRMIRIIGKENIPEELNYSFVKQTEEEEKINIEHFKEDYSNVQNKDKLRNLLITDLDPEDDIFNSKGLIDNLNNAIKLGKAAGLPWEVRECYYQFLNIYESKRDNQELRKKSNKLGNIYDIIHNRQISSIKNELATTQLSEKSSSSLNPSASNLSVSAQLSANSSAPSFIGVPTSGEDSDTYQTPLPNSVNPISTPLYFYLVEWIKHGKSDKSLIYASTISDLKQFADFLNNPAVSRFDYGANAAVYQSTYEAESKETNGIVVSPVTPVKDPSFTNQIYEFTQDFRAERNNTKDPFHRHYTFTTVEPQPNSNITAKVKDVKIDDYNRFDDLQHVVEESINNMQNERKQLQNELPSQQNYESWLNAKPTLPVELLYKAIFEAASGADKARPSLREAKQKFATNTARVKTISQLANRWVNEMESSLSLYFTVINNDKQSLESNLVKLRSLNDNVNAATSELFPNRKIAPTETPLAKDPLLYFCDYEEF